MYQLNPDGEKDRVYKKYWDSSDVHLSRRDIMTMYLKLRPAYHLSSLSAGCTRRAGGKRIATASPGISGQHPVGKNGSPIWSGRLESLLLLEGEKIVGTSPAAVPAGTGDGGLGRDCLIIFWPEYWERLENSLLRRSEAVGIHGLS